ncbi:MAG: 2-phosphosulfolactate phosphatase [Bacteroidetes bacterium]|nr:MAG: 2-phosphosulfolactate phosphatase [Bacteroidota bacterium]
MKISVIPYAAAARPELTHNKTIVVIDVLRATSVMLTALANGAYEVVPAISPEEVLQKSLLYNPEEVLLAGEQQAVKIEGFHLGNSPLEFTREKVSGKTIIMSTTNGTKALNSCLNAKVVLIGAFLNTEAIITRLLQEEEVVLFCSGTNNNFSLDDGLCAAMIIDGLVTQLTIKPTLSDFGSLLLKAYRSNKNLSESLKECHHLNLLKLKGFEHDVTYCLQNSLCDIVPTMNLISKSIK